MMAVFSKLNSVPLSLSLKTFSRRMANYPAITSTPQKDLPRSLGHVFKRGKPISIWHYLGLLAIPILGFAYYNAFHRHPKKKRPDFVPWPHLRIRKVPYPWGDGIHTLLHHPYYNALPMGYETDDDGNPMPEGTYWQGNYTVEEGYPTPPKFG